ncbi:hypothetical protein ACMGOD_004304 [Klebsiella oxytoca]
MSAYKAGKCALQGASLFAARVSGAVEISAGKKFAVISRSIWMILRTFAARRRQVLAP